MKKIKRLIAFDFDGTLANSPEPETGKQIWLAKTGEKFPYSGWWGRKESLDMNIFDIKMFPSMVKQLKFEQSKPDTYVMVLTSRRDDLRPEVQAILDANDIHVDSLDMQRVEQSKGAKILRYIGHIPELEEISVYDDRESDIESYESIRSQIPEGIAFNIYLANKGSFVLTELEVNDKLTHIIMEEIKKFNPPK